MGKFRKKPVVIEARRFSVGQCADVASELATWCGGELVRHPDNYRHIAVNTLEGVMLAQEGDWIIKGVKGEFYPCKPDIFAATYEPAE